MSGRGRGWPRRVTIVGLSLAVAVLAAGLMLPVRVSQGAGSLRCGSVGGAVAASDDSELERDCRAAVTERRVPATLTAAGAVLLATLLPWLTVGWAQRHGWVRSAVNTTVGVWWFVTLGMGLLWMTAAF